MRVYRPGARDHVRWHRAYRFRALRPFIIWNSKATQSDGDTSSIVLPPRVKTIRGFSFSVQDEPTSDMEINLTLAGSSVATATLAPASGKHSEVECLALGSEEWDDLQIELTTLGGAGLPLHAYVEVA